MSMVKSDLELISGAHMYRICGWNYDHLMLLASIHDDVDLLVRTGLTHSK